MYALVNFMRLQVPIFNVIVPLLLMDNFISYI